MAKIALGMHLEATVHDIQYDIRCINDRLSQHQSLLHDLQEGYQSTTTKAELHAAMACLTYKNMGLALPSESLHDVIKNQFNKTEQNRPSEIKGYLANPFEALASMAEKIKKMELLRKEETEKHAYETIQLKEEIHILKKSITDQDHHLSKLSTDMGATQVALQKLLYQQQLQLQQQQLQLQLQSKGNNSTLSKPPLLTTLGIEDSATKERENSLNQPLDMATYWNIPEEEGLDDLQDGQDDVATPAPGDDHDSQIAVTFPIIPPPDENTPVSLLTPSNASQSSLQSQNDKSDLPSSLGEGRGGDATDSHDNFLSSTLPPSEPSSSSHRPSQRLSFMSTRRKISAVNAISLPGEPSVPPTKARTSMVRTIQKPDSTTTTTMAVLSSNHPTLSQFQEFRQERVAIENELKSRLKSVENITSQVNTLHEALKILSEEIRVTSEELTGSMKKDIIELKEGQLSSFQEVFKVIEHCFSQIKHLQTVQSKQKASGGGNSFGLESIQHEFRILQQNVESLRTQVIIQSTKQTSGHQHDSHHDPSHHHGTNANANADAVTVAADGRTGVPQEEVEKIATDINKLDTSMTLLSQRCNSLHDEFVLHQETIKSTLQDQIHTPQHPSLSTMTLTLDRDLTQEMKAIQEFQESKIQEIQSISEEIKQLQEEINTVKTLSSEIFEKYHVSPVLVSQLAKAHPGMTNSLLAYTPRLDQYALNDSRYLLIQSDVNELKEKMEQVYYLALSAVSIAESKQGPSQQFKYEEDKKPSISLQHLNFPTTHQTNKKEIKSILPPRPSASASSTRKKPNSATGQRPNSSIEASRPHNSSDDLLTPPTVSFVDTIEPPLRPPPPRNPTTYLSVSRPSPRGKGKSQPPQPTTTATTTTIVTSSSFQPTPTQLQQQLLLLAGGSLDENSLNSGVLIPPFDDLRIGESNSSIWERDNSMNQLTPSLNQSEINNLPNALLYGSITVRDAVKYDKAKQHDEAWYRSYETPSDSLKRSNPFKDVSKQGAGGGGGQGGGGGYVSSLTEYTGNWKIPLSTVHSVQNK